MKKILSFFVIAAIFLTACGSEIEDPNSSTTSQYPEIDNNNPYYINFIGGPAYHGWYDFLDTNRDESETQDIFVYHKIQSLTEAKDLITELTNQKQENYINLIILGIGPDDYVGNSQEEAEANFESNKAYIQELIDLTLNKGFVLFVSNGYPKPAEETDEFLLWNHEQMRLFLKEQMETTGRVYNFTMKRPLANSDGSLNSGLTEEDKNGTLLGELITYLGLVKHRL